MQLIVQLRSDIANEIQSQLESSAVKAIRAAMEGTGCSLVAQHPGNCDAILSTYFQVETADRESTELIQQRLLACEGVEAAYVKSPDEMPM